MYTFVCKECKKEFKSKFKNTKYCSNNCRVINTNSNLTHNQVNLIGKRYGKLTVLDKAYIKNNSSYWKCKCDCGKEKNISIDSLTSGNAKSCGCLISTTSSKHMKTNKTILNYKEENYVEGTNLNALKRGLTKSNNSGVKGVYWSSYHQRWKAFIYFKNKRYYLGVYKNLEDAKKARLEAEEKYFKPILDKYKK